MSIKTIFFLFVFLIFGTFGVWVPQVLYGFDTISFCIGAGTYICSTTVCSTIERLLSQFGELSKKSVLIYSIAIAVAVAVCLFITVFLNQEKNGSAIFFSILGTICVFRFWWYQNKNNSAFNEPENALGGKI